MIKFYSLYCLCTVSLTVSPLYGYLISPLTSCEGEGEREREGGREGGREGEKERSDIMSE